MKKVIILLILGMFLINSVSSFEFDNIKSIKDNFNYKEDTVSITSSFLWLFPTGKVADIKLLDNTDECLTDCKTKFSVKLYEDYDNPMTREYFIDREDNNVKGIIGNWYYYDDSTYEIDIPNYKEVCSIAKNSSEVCEYVQDGTKKKTMYNNVWREYKGGTFEAGEYIFEYRGKKNPHESVDFKMELFGVDLGDEYVWWNADWDYKKEVKIQENSGQNYKNFSANLSVTYEANMDSDFEDLRFLDSTETTELDYWIEEYTASTSAQVWVKLPSVTANTNTTIYMYYGNGAASTTGDYEEAFLFADNFSDGTYSDKYNSYNTAGATITESNGYLNITSNNPTTLLGKQNLSDEENGWIILESRVRQFTSAIGQSLIGLSDGFTEGGNYDDFGATNPNASVLMRQQDSAWRIIGEINGANTWFVGSNDNSWNTVYRNVQMVKRDDNVTGFSDGVVVVNRTLDNSVDGGVLMMANSGDSLSYDFVRVRRFWSVEPTITFGSEENNLDIPVVSSVNLNAPDDSYSSTNGTIFFGSNATISNGNFTNTTLYIWDSDMDVYTTSYETRTGATNISNISIESIPVANNYSWNFYWCGNNGSVDAYNCSWATSNRTFDISLYTENEVNYTSLAYETTSQNFSYNFSTGLDILSVDAKLNYNGTNYDSTSSCSGSECVLTNDIDLGLISGDSTVENSFYWNITIYDGTSSYNSASSTYTQNVSRIYLQSCNSTINATIFNYTAYDENNLTRINPFSFEGTFSYWLGNGDVKRTSSVSNTSAYEYNLCILPNQTMKIEATIEYDDAGNVTDYVKRNYYYDNYSVSPQTDGFTNVPLLLLESGDSTTFIQEVLENYQEVEDAYIYTYRYYPGAGTWNITQITKTDSNGRTVGFYQAETAIYRHEIYIDGILRLNESAGKAIPDEVPYTLTWNLGEGVGEPHQEYDEELLLTKSLSYNDDTKIVTYTYTDTNSTFSQGRLLVLEEKYATDDEVICNTTSALSSVTITCNITNYEGNFIASGFITRNGEEILVDQIGFSNGTGKDIFGKTGMLLGWFIILVAAMAFLWHPVVGIIAVDITMIMVNLIGLIQFSRLTLFGIIGVSIIILILMRD